MSSWIVGGGVVRLRIFCIADVETIFPRRWDVQRIRELRQNERLKEKLRRRKSRWNKLESPKQPTAEEPEQVSTLFPDIKSIEKILITDAVPVTALGTSIPKTPSW